jgi:hypothetical protein
MALACLSNTSDRKTANADHEVPDRRTATPRASPNQYQDALEMKKITLAGTDPYVAWGVWAN